MRNPKGQLYKQEVPETGLHKDESRFLEETEEEGGGLNCKP